MVTPVIKAKTVLLIATALLLGFMLKVRFCFPGRVDYTAHPLSTSYSQSQPLHFDLNAILQRGKLIALTDYSSTGYFIYKGEPMGYEYDMLSAYAKSIGVRLQVNLATDMNEVFNRLNKGDADIAAANLTITQDRSRIIAFTKPLMSAKQVLIQRKPDNWKRMTSEQIDQCLVRNTVDLAGKIIHVRKGSSFYERLKNLSEEIGSEIHIIQANGDKETEQLIAMVANGNIDYTVADENVALINQTYYPNIDIRTAISFPQYIAWAVRKTSGALLESLNRWLDNMSTSGAKTYIYNKYFRNNKAAEERAGSDYFSLTGGKISEYDDLIKTYSSRINWDWRLLASLIYEESHFDASARSWTGAYGLMQIIPATSVYYGIDSLNATPLESIRAGTSLIMRMDNYWKQYITDSTERVKFVLASYNVGLGHVIDARSLAVKYGKDAQKWENNVAWCLLMKSGSKFYNDPVVKFGYCRGAQPCTYVDEILTRYEHYCNFIPKDEKNSFVIQ